MPKSRHEQMDFAGLEIVADEFTGTFNGEIEGVASEATSLETPRNLTLTGDITATLTGFDGTADVSAVAAIGAGVIVNADVNASAAIARTKLAAHGVAAESTANAANTGDWVADGAAVVALVNALKTKINALITAV